MKKLEALTIEELKNHRDALEEEKQQLIREYDALSKALQGKRSTIKKISELIDERTLTETDYEKILDIYPETDYKYDLRRKVLSQWNLDTDGYFLETGQSTIQITLYRRDDETLHATYYGIKKLLHIIKPLQDGKKHFKIFERTLSANGIYDLTIEKNEFQVIRTRYGRETVVYKSDNLMAALKYIQQNHFYEGEPNPYVKRQLKINKK